MKPVFGSVALSLTMAVALAAVSVSLFAKSARGKASATVVKPAVISTAMPLSTSAITSGITGDQTVRIPGTGSSESHDNINFIRAALMPNLASNNVHRGGNAAVGIDNDARSGILRGDPVTSLSLEIVSDTQLDGNIVQITVTYN